MNQIYKELETKGWNIYSNSINQLGKNIVFMAKKGKDKNLFVIEDNSKFNLKGKKIKLNSGYIKKCSLSHENAVWIRDKFDFTKPSNLNKKGKSLGLGDRLGLATPGHIRAIRDTNFQPVFAQQSMRELNLMNRSYESVLDDVTWAVIQEGWKSGYVADGDHLKTTDEIKNAIDAGYTMITVDCSNHINNKISKLNNDEVKKYFNRLSEDTKSYYLNKYLNKKFKIPDSKGYINLKYKKDMLQRLVLIYHNSIKFIEKINNELIKPCKRSIDLEISIDETLTVTSPEAHFLVAKELADHKIDFVSIAPRFCGEYQKGIDYIGDIEQFRGQYHQHARVADYFDYKLSIHSGSDKFSVFKIIAEESRERFHIKTSGTSYLEAIRLVAQKDPKLYEEIHKYSIKHLDKAKKYYHIDGKPENVMPIKFVDSSGYKEYLNQDDMRQILHINYGNIFDAINNDEKPKFKEKLYDFYKVYEKDYINLLISHIGKHIEYLS